MAKLQRIQALDVTRGIAMVLVCISHFFDVYDLQRAMQDSWLMTVISSVCRIATPTFILVSGMVLGYQVAIKGVTTPVLRFRLIDRALFLVTIGHVLIALALTARWGWWHAFFTGQVTDTIAFCIIGGLLIVPRTSYRVRFVLGVVFLAVNWLTWWFWIPVDPILLLIKSVFLGPSAELGSVFMFPLLPWFGWYLVGSSIGEILAGASVENILKVCSRVRVVSIGMISVAMIIKLGLLQGIVVAQSWYPFISPYQKYPPGPIYLLLMGGAAMFLVSAVFSVGDARWMGGVRKLVVPIGQNSLAVFIVQFFVYYSFLYLVFLKNPSMPVVLVGALLFISLAGILIFAIFCRRYHVSRWLTIGVTEVDSHLKKASILTSSPAYFVRHL